MGTRSCTWQIDTRLMVFNKKRIDKREKEEKEEKEKKRKDVEKKKKFLPKTLIALVVALETNLSFLLRHFRKIRP